VKLNAMEFSIQIFAMQPMWQHTLCFSHGATVLM